MIPHPQAPQATTRRLVTFRVLGIPQPKGSTKAFVPMKWAAAAVATGKPARAIVTSDNPALKDWQLAIHTTAQELAESPFNGPIAITLLFRLVRPKSAPRRVTHPTSRPDVDKLARAVLDGLTGVLFVDDAAVVELSAAKCYAPPAGAPGVEVTIREAAERPDRMTPLLDGWEG